MVGGRGAQFQCRLFRLVQALIFGALAALSVASFGFLGTYLEVWVDFCLVVGAHHCRLRHIGWEKCGHGLTSRPKETSDPVFLDSLSEVFGYPARSGRLLLAGELPLRYYSGNFALRKPSWSLPNAGAVKALLTAFGPDAGASGSCDGWGQMNPGSFWTRGAGGIWKRVRLTKKTASALVRRHGDLHDLHGKRWKRLHTHGVSFGDDGSCKKGAFVTA